MRRIKTYVLMVGVALSVTPIFHYSHAQQSNSNTQLLLDVQALRQEIAELRDMVERQNYQMKRLQRQIDESAQSNRVGAQGQANSVYNSPNSSYPQQASSYSQQIANAQGGTAAGVDDQLTQDSQAIGQSARTLPSSIALPNDTTAQAATQGQQGDFSQPNGVVQAANQNQAPDAASFYRPYPNTDGVDAGSQSSVASVTQQTGNYPPVVDRSFNTTTPEVPITGAGSQSTTSQQFQPASPTQNNWRTSQQLDVPNSSQQIQTAVQQTPAAQQGEVSQPLSNDLEGQASQTIRPSTGGVVSIPTLPSTAPENQAINAAQAPVPGGAPLSNSAQQGLALNSTPQNQTSDQAQAVNQGQAVSAAPAAVKPESDFYSEGISLLKQSQYEQAAVIFEQQLQAHPGGSLADGAHYWIAEAMFLNRKLDVAKSHLKTIIRDYPQSSRVPNAMLKTAYIEQGQGNQIEARILFQEIVTLYPQSDAAIAAKNQLASDS